MANGRWRQRRAGWPRPHVSGGIPWEGTMTLSSVLTRSATPRATIRRRPLASALLVALMLPGLAFAQTAKEKELEARVAELERMVQSLVSQQQQVQTQVTEVKAA